MTRELLTLEPDASLGQVHQLMGKKNIRHIPVVKNGILFGIVSHRDLLSATPVSGENRSRVYSETRVTDIMRTGVETVSPETTARFAAMKLDSLKIGCLPVLSEGALVGINTSSDFITTAITLLDQLENEEGVT